MTSVRLKQVGPPAKGLELLRFVVEVYLKFFGGVSISFIAMVLGRNQLR